MLIETSLFVLAGDFPIEQWKELIWKEIEEFAEQRAQRFTTARRTDDEAMSGTHYGR
uniref:Uncharacterized protein n=1 Tax=Parascaris equorum TaxID=6256 RepID=A0A914R2Q2_PAREQ